MALQPELNGISVEDLTKTIESIKEKPAIARFRFRAHHKWINGAHSCTDFFDFYGEGEEDTSRRKTFTLDSDEPPILLGDDHGPNATEAALHALAACLDTTLIYHASIKGIKIDSLEIELEGDLDLRGFLGLSKEIRSGYEQIRITVNIKSDASDDKIRELCKLAQKRSPVFDMFVNVVPIAVNIEHQR